MLSHTLLFVEEHMWLIALLTGCQFYWGSVDHQFVDNKLFLTVQAHQEGTMQLSMCNRIDEDPVVSCMGNTISVQEGNDLSLRIPNLRFESVVEIKVYQEMKDGSELDLFCDEENPVADITALYEDDEERMILPVYREDCVLRLYVGDWESSTP